MRQAYLVNYARIAKVPMVYEKVTTATGAHLVIWTDFMEWGSDEERREFVEKGTKAIHEARKNTQDGVITSIIMKESSNT